MSSPLQLSDLPLASVANSADIMLLRKDNTTDFKISVAAIRAIDLTVYNGIPFAQGNDLMLIQRNSSVYNIRYSQVGFVKGVRSWFYQGQAPTGWTIVKDTGDRLLAVSSPATSGGNQNYNPSVGGANPGTQSGIWQQSDAFLTVAQLPVHTHGVGIFSSTNGDTSNGAGPGKKPKGGTETSDPTGSGLGHNHGNTWRPLANVGIICEKTS